MPVLQAPSTAPVHGAERMAVLDAVRGAALLGILLVNVVAFSGLAFLPPPAVLVEWHAPAMGVLALLFEGKFYSLFSFLFGVGFAVFVGRAVARGADGARLFKRRLTGLLLIGLLHTLFIWMGDILATYALIGFALLPFIRRDDRSVLRWAGAMLLLPIPLYAALVLAARLAGMSPQPAASAGTLPPILTDAVNGFVNGGYGELVKGNAIFTIADVVRRFLLMFFPRVFGMFLLGYYVGRRNIFGDLDAHLPLIWRVFVWGTVLGLPFSFAGVLVQGHSLGVPGVAGLVETSIKSIGVPALSLGYAAGLCLLFRRAPGLRRGFAPVGQLALTNYLLQSVAALTIFYGLGFGLMGRVPLIVALAGAGMLFGIQMIASRMWLRVARFGPAEWAWRVFTYRRRVPLFA